MANFAQDQVLANGSLILLQVEGGSLLLDRGGLLARVLLLPNPVRLQFQFLGELLMWPLLICLPSLWG